MHRHFNPTNPQLNNQTKSQRNPPHFTAKPNLITTKPTTFLSLSLSHFGDVVALDRVHH
jgi:hypothetical protein